MEDSSSYRRVMPSGSIEVALHWSPKDMLYVEEVVDQLGVLFSNERGVPAVSYELAG
jgi:hypothetical protein